MILGLVALLVLVVVACVVYFIYSKPTRSASASPTADSQKAGVSATSTAPEVTIEPQEPFKIVYYSECKMPRMYDESRSAAITTAEVIKAASGALYSSKYAEPPQVGVPFLLMRGDAPESATRPFLEAVAASIKASGKAISLYIEVTEPISEQVRNDDYKQGSMVSIEFRETGGVDMTDVIQAYDTTDPALRAQYRRTFLVLEESSTETETIYVPCPEIGATTMA